MEKRKLDQFEFVEINGMKLSEPRQAYVQILKQLSGKALTWEQAFNALQKRFNSSVKRPMTVLLVDEVCLCIHFHTYVSYYFVTLCCVLLTKLLQFVIIYLYSFVSLLL